VEDAVDGGRLGPWCIALIAGAGAVAAATPAVGQVQAQAVIAVVNGNDTGLGSYRAAINTANTNGDAEPDVIRFDPGLAVVLTSADVAYTGTQPITLEGAGSSIDGSNANQILGAGSAAAVTVDALTVRNGDAGIGGAINTAGNVTVTNSTFSGNHGDIGGAVNAAGNVAVTNSTFSGNDADIGGAINNAGDVTMTNSTFSGNEGIVGGGVNNSGTATIGSSTFSTNQSVIGGAINSSDDVTITQSTFTANKAPGGVGGAVAGHSRVSASNTLFADNIAGAGGAIATAASIATVTGALSVDSTPNEVRAGDVHLEGVVAPAQLDQAIELTATTLSADHATIGGGVAGGESISVNLGVVTINGAAELSALNSTLTGNTADESGGSLAIPFGTVTLVYVTSSDNAAPAGAQLVADSLTAFGTALGPAQGGTNCQAGSTTTEGYNFSTDASCGLTGVGDRQGAGDPMLGALADNGGPTPTRLPLESSPLIDGVPIGACQADGASGVTTDQRGVGRPQRAGCDIGAVEVEPPAPAPLVITPTFAG